MIQLNDEFEFNNAMKNRFRFENVRGNNGFSYEKVGAESFRKRKWDFVWALLGDTREWGRGVVVASITVQIITAAFSPTRAIYRVSFTPFVSVMDILRDRRG